MVDLKLEGEIARIFLNRPGKSNALSFSFLEQLERVFRELKGEERLRVAVLAGHGKAFCGGADVKELAALTEADADGFVEQIHRVCAAIRALPVPVVASIHGACIGAGLEIAAACDLRIAAEGTKFAMPEVRLGIPSVVEAALLPRLMGAGRAAWLVLTGEAIDARRAGEWGLVEQVTADLGGATERLVQSLLAGDARALKMQKELIQLWDEAPLARSVARSLELFAEAHRK
jgi:enoyl-CoA hydratase/carnithine racemase